MLSTICVRHAPQCASATKNRIVFKLSQVFFSNAAARIAPPISAQQLDSKSYVSEIADEWNNGKSFGEIPGLTRYQLFRGFMKGGEFADMSVNDLLLLCRKRYGDIFKMPGLFGQPSFVTVFKVNDFEKVHRTEGSYPIRPGLEVMTMYRNSRRDKFFDEWHGLFVHGEKWAKFRTAVNPVLMQPRNAKLYLDSMQNVNDEFLQRIREIRDPITMEVPGTFIKDINNLTFESVAVVALDKQLGLIRQTASTHDANELFKHLNVFLKAFYELGIKPSLYKYISTPTYRRFETAMDGIFDITSKFVNEAIERIETTKGESGREPSVLEKLLQIDRKIAIIMAMDMLMAGVDTTSSVLSGILISIAKNPEKQQKLREELLSILPNKNDRLTIDNLKKLPYLRACIKESMRLYPILFGNARESGMDIVLSGYRVPKGTKIFMCSNLILKEAEHFPRATEFIPERWLRSSDVDGDEKLKKDNLNPFIYLPFGFGPRSCVGKRIVDMELEITLANLVRNFNIEFNYPVDNAFKTYFLSTPVIPLKFKFAEHSGN